MSRAPLTLILVCLVGCAGGPPPADWQIGAQSGLERSTAAYLSGNARVEALEFERARDELARTGRTDLLARAELIRCAARVASLVFEPCAGFEDLRADAPAAERAYADYLAARPNPQDLPLLPAQHRAVAAALPGTADAAGVLRELNDPLACLVAAAVLLQAGRASPGVLAAAVDAASAQGWRRPLSAWLGLQAAQADKAGDSDAAQRVRRRIAQVLGAP